MTYKNDKKLKLGSKRDLVIYISGPYTDVSYEAEEANIKNAGLAGLLLTKKGYTVIVPHMNTAHFNVHNGEKTEDGEELSRKIWLEQDFKLLSTADMVYVLKNMYNSVGERSKGTDEEIALAKSRGIPVIYEEKENWEEELNKTAKIIAKKKGLEELVK